MRIIHDDAETFSVETDTNCNSDNLIRVSGSGVDGFTTEAQLLADLKNDFPMYTDTVKYYTTKYCTYLAQNVSVRITECRNAYTRLSANYQSFAVGTALSIIATFIGAPVSVIESILTVLGITYNMYDMLTQSAKLYNAASYRYYGERCGRVFDSTRYNTYVQTIHRTGYGEFHGGYNSSGVFTWIHYSQSAAYNYAYSDLSTTAMRNYNNDLTIYGVCTSYEP